MFVRKGRSNDKNPVIKVPISKLWYKKQKLDDKYILGLFRQCLTLEDNFKKKMEVSWEFEAGKLFIIDLDITKIENVEDKAEEKLPEQTEELKPLPKAIERSMEEYIEEVGKIRKDMTSVNSNVEGSDEQIVVNIKPIEELHILAQGKSKGEKMVFGLVHFALADSSYDDLTGDEILVIRNVNPHYYEVLNSVRGLIIQEDIDSSDLLDIKIPVISDIADAFDIFQENEVVTLRPWNGTVYLGAGKETVDKKNEMPKIAHEVKDGVEFDAKEEQPAVKQKSADVEINKTPIAKTILDFWQTYYPNQALDNLSGIDGLVVRVADIMEKYQKDIFENELASKLIEILKMADGKPVIMVSAGRDELMEEIVEAELDAISQMRNKDYLRNLWYCFDNIVDVDDLVKLKKLFVNKGFRRSTSLKLFLAIHSPQSFIVLNGFLESGIDGVLIDLDLMFREHGIKVKHNDPHMIEYIAHKIAKISEAKTQSMLLAYEHKIEPAVLKPMLQAGLNAVALTKEEIANLKPVVSEVESTVSRENKKKRGRKRKEIDFGY
jgi:phosphohistidine swiveling domain-containing protein